MDKIGFMIKGGSAFVSKLNEESTLVDSADLTPFLDGGLEGLSLTDIESDHGGYDRIELDSETAIDLKCLELQITARFSVIDVRGTERGQKRYDDDFGMYPYLDLTDGLKLVANTDEKGEVELPLLDYVRLEDISPLSPLCPGMGALLGGKVNVVDGRLHFTAVFKPDRLIMGMNCAQLGQ